MLARCAVFIATSLDGYIARADGGIDWLERVQQGLPPGEDCGYGRFISTVDGLVMGRKTLELVLSFPQWPYGDLPVHVLSSQWTALPPGVPASVSLSQEAPAALVRRLSEQGARRLYVDGGATIQRFLQDGLIDELTITRIPILLGGGRPLFGALERDIEWEHVDTRTYPLGLVQSVYRLRREA